MRVKAGMIFAGENPHKNGETCNARSVAGIGFLRSHYVYCFGEFAWVGGGGTFTGGGSLTGVCDIDFFPRTS